MEIAVLGRRISGEKILARPPLVYGPLDRRSALNRLALQLAPPPVSVGLQAGRLALQSFLPDIPEPPLAVAVAPVAGSAWQAAEDLQEGDYVPAMANGSLVAFEAYPGFAAATQAARVKRVNEMLKYAERAGSRPLTDRNVREAFGKAGFTGKKTGQEAHHTFPFNGVDRGPANWRNHPWFVEPRLIPTHRRITGSWKGQPQFGPLTRAWHESSNVLKAGIGGAAAYATDMGENLFRDDEPPKKPQR